MSTITFTGNIGKSQGLKFSNDGKPRLSFSAAETARVKDQSGQYVDGGTTWFNVTLFGYTAEALDAAIAEAGGKGKVIVSGRMSTREYEHNGEKRESLDVVADSVGLVPRGQSQGQSRPAAYAGNTPQQDPWAANQAPTGNNAPGGWGNGNQAAAPF
jgi:single stranded DNA-binding protein